MEAGLVHDMQPKFVAREPVEQSEQRFGSLSEFVAFQADVVSKIQSQVAEMQKDLWDLMKIKNEQCMANQSSFVYMATKASFDVVFGHFNSESQAKSEKINQLTQELEKQKKKTQKMFKRRMVLKPSKKDKKRRQKPSEDAINMAKLIAECEAYCQTVEEEEVEENDDEVSGTSDCENTNSEPMVEGTKCY